MIHFGEIEVHTLSDGLFRFDGGAMFGIVPRVIWEKNYPPDELNRVSLAARSLLRKPGGL